MGIELSLLDLQFLELNSTREELWSMATHCGTICVS